MKIKPHFESHLSEHIEAMIQQDDVEPTGGDVRVTTDTDVRVTTNGDRRVTA
jgi:hypothetical protein